MPGVARCHSAIEFCQAAQRTCLRLNSLLLGFAVVIVITHRNQRGVRRNQLRPSASLQRFSLLARHSSKDSACLHWKTRRLASLQNGKLANLFGRRGKGGGRRAFAFPPSQMFHEHSTHSPMSCQQKSNDNNLWGGGDLDFSTNIYVVTLSGHLINTCLRANLQE